MQHLWKNMLLILSIMNDDVDEYLSIEFLCKFIRPTIESKILTIRRPDPQWTASKLAHAKNLLGSNR